MNFPIAEDEQFSLMEDPGGRRNEQDCMDRCAGSESTQRQYNTESERFRNSDSFCRFLDMHVFTDVNKPLFQREKPLPLFHDLFMADQREFCCGQVSSLPGYICSSFKLITAR